VLGNRCYSDDPGLTRAFVTAFIAGHHDRGIGATAKHFPGHGGTEVDSHVGLPEVRNDMERLRHEDLIPFAGAVEAGVDCLMVSHVWYSALDPKPTPATVSPAAARLAREELRFDGPIVTDAMEMGAIQSQMTTGEAIPRAITAGCDLAIVSSQLDQQHEAVEALWEAARIGQLSSARISEASRRLEALRCRIGAAAADWPTDGARLTGEIARRAVTLVRDEHGYLPLGSDAEDSHGVVTFPATAAVQVEEHGRIEALLAQAARRRVASVTAIDILSETGTDSVLRRLDGIRTVLVGTAFAGARPFQAAIVNALLQAGKRLIAVALRDPFDLLAYPAAPCFLATYDDTAASVEAAVSVIFGENTPQGHLPVALPGLYPRGHGITSL
jgi:beta-N-acetylhexosaminidase